MAVTDLTDPIIITVTLAQGIPGESGFGTRVAMPADSSAPGNADEVAWDGDEFAVYDTTAGEWRFAQLYQK